eukprot:752422-Hanusia_phi.AAC.7
MNVLSRLNRNFANNLMRVVYIAKIGIDPRGLANARKKILEQHQSEVELAHKSAEVEINEKTYLMQLEQEKYTKELQERFISEVREARREQKEIMEQEFEEEKKAWAKSLNEMEEKLNQANKKLAEGDYDLIKHVHYLNGQISNLTKTHKKLESEIQTKDSELRLLTTEKRSIVQEKQEVDALYSKTHMNFRRSERDKEKEFKKRQKAEAELKVAKQENKVLTRRLENVNEEIQNLQNQNNRLEHSLKLAKIELQRYGELEKDLEKMSRAYKEEKFAKEKETRKQLSLSQEVTKLEKTIKDNNQEVERLKQEVEEERQKALAGTLALKGVELEIEKRVSESRSLQVMREIRGYLIRRLEELEHPVDSSNQTSVSIINIFEGQHEGFVEAVRRNRKQLHKAIIELEINHVSRQEDIEGSQDSQSSIHSDDITFRNPPSASASRRSLRLTHDSQEDVAEVPRPTSAFAPTRTAKLGFDRKRPTSALTMFDMRARKEFS